MAEFYFHFCKCGGMEIISRKGKFFPRCIYCGRKVKPPAYTFKNEPKPQK